MFPVANRVPLRYPPIATWALIATNAIVFLFEVGLSPSELNEFLYRFALVPARYFDSGIFRQFAVVGRLSALRQQHVLTRRLAAPDRQYVDLVAVRESGRGPTRLGALSR